MKWERKVGINDPDDLRRNDRGIQFVKEVCYLLFDLLLHYLIIIDD